MKENLGGVKGISLSVVIIVAEVLVLLDDMLGREGEHRASEGGRDVWDVPEEAKCPSTLGRHLDAPTADIWGDVLCVEMSRVGKLEDRLCCLDMFLPELELGREPRGKKERRDGESGDAGETDNEAAGEDERKERWKLRNDEGVWRILEVRPERVVVGVFGVYRTR